ncbi:MAG: hypothetical protein PVJ01_06605, partial [Pseudomonadota bacterium]
MKITLQTVSEFTHYFGAGETELEVACATVRDLLEYLRTRYRFDFIAHKYTMLFVNGRGCVDFTHTLKDGD